MINSNRSPIANDAQTPHELIYSPEEFDLAPYGDPQLVKNTILTIMVGLLLLLLMGMFNFIGEIDPLTKAIVWFISIAMLLVGGIISLVLVRRAPFQVYRNGITLDTLPLIRGIKRDYIFISNSRIKSVRFDRNDRHFTHTGIIISYQTEKGTLTDMHVKEIDDIYLALKCLKTTMSEKIDTSILELLAFIDSKIAEEKKEPLPSTR